MTTYTEDLMQAIMEIRERTLGGLTRIDRAVLIERVSSKYAYNHAAYNDMRREQERFNAEQVGRKPAELPFNPPDSAMLERLTDLFLHEEITDTSPDKATKYEYPFLSAYQLARRRDGSHSGKVIGQHGESPLKGAATYGPDKRDHRNPTRRKRSVYEGIYVDNIAKIRNEERRRKYNAFIAPGEVIKYKRSGGE